MKPNTKNKEMTIIGTKKEMIKTAVGIAVTIIAVAVFILMPETINTKTSTPDIATYDEVTVEQETTTLHIETTAEPTTAVPTTEEITTEEPTTEEIKEVKQVEEPKVEISEVEVEEETIETPNFNHSYSDYELELVARTTYCEAGSCSEYCQWLVASTILNLADRNGGVTNVCSNSNMFNVAPIIWSKTPSSLSYSVAERVMSGDRDYNVMAFREGYYHEWATPYTNTDGVYFSTY